MVQDKDMLQTIADGATNMVDNKFKMQDKEIEVDVSLVQDKHAREKGEI